MLVPDAGATQLRPKRMLPLCRRARRPAEALAAFAVVAAAVAATNFSPSFAAHRFPRASFPLHEGHTVLTGLTSLLAQPRGFCTGQRSDTRARQSHHGILVTAAAVEGAPDAASAGIPLWLDFRQERLARLPGSGPYVSLKVSEDWNPSIKSALNDLMSGLREKLKIIGVTDLSDKVVAAALVDEEKAETIIEEVKDLGMAVYTASRDIDGLTLPGGASWVFDATSKKVIGGLQAPPLALSQTVKLTPLDVWKIEPKATEDEKPQISEKAEAADGDKVNIDKLCELLNIEDQDRDAVAVQPGRTLAKVVPPEPLLWARALMLQRKESGAGRPAYSS